MVYYNYIPFHDFIPFYTMQINIHLHQSINKSVVDNEIIPPTLSLSNLPIQSNQLKNFNQMKF